MRAPPAIRGLSATLHRVLMETLKALLATPELDADIERRARWLHDGLEGRRPENELPFIADAPALAPSIDAADAMVG